MKKVKLFMCFLLTAIWAGAQHEHHQMQKDTMVPALVQPNMDHQSKFHQPEEADGPATHAYSRNLPMSRNGSGTGWNPDSSPMYMWMHIKGRSSWMFHGNIFMRYTSQDIFSAGSRGGDAFSTPNWFMGMWNRKLGKRGLFNATAMISLDRLTDGGNGYPLLFQSGETFRGNRLTDRQHPHDLFSALSIGYTQMINKDADLFLYLGYPGEPALGAPAFMHRISSMNNPDAPLGHHWQDATHITFGTGTAGFRYKNFKAEASVFTGREPDEKRFGFDPARLNSYAFRLSYQPGRNWTLQVSKGYIKSPEAITPDEDLNKTTASVLFARQVKKEKHFSAAAIWGLNDKGGNHREHSFLLEGNYQYHRNALYSRYEFVQKSGEELDLDESFPHRNFAIHNHGGGYNRRIASFRQIDLLTGTQISVYAADRTLQSLYGKNPLSFQIYLQLRPSIHQH